jgi:hypothetical protein
MHLHLKFHSTIFPIPTTLVIGYVGKATPALWWFYWKKEALWWFYWKRKAFLQHAYKCLNLNCLKSFKFHNGLCMHFGKSQQCSNFEMSGNNTRANTARQPLAAEAQESLTEYPWDEDESVHESKDASSIEDIISTGALNNQADVYAESANDATLRFGIRFTTEHFHETKLLKLLSDDIQAEVWNGAVEKKPN